MPSEWGILSKSRKVIITGRCSWSRYCLRRSSTICSGSERVAAVQLTRRSVGLLRTKTSRRFFAFARVVKRSCFSVPLDSAQNILQAVTRVSSGNCRQTRFAETGISGPLTLRTQSPALMITAARAVQNCWGDACRVRFSSPTRGSGEATSFATQRPDQHLQLS